MVVIRTDKHSDLIDLTKYSNIPIINGLSDKSHPCQVLSDIFTFEEIIGSIEGKKVVWLGDSNNVCNSYIQASKKLNFELVISGPREFLSSEINRSTRYQYEMHPEKALKNAALLNVSKVFQQLLNFRTNFFKQIKAFINVSIVLINF